MRGRRSPGGGGVEIDPPPPPAVAATPARRWPTAAAARGGGGWGVGIMTPPQRHIRPARKEPGKGSMLHLLAVHQRGAGLDAHPTRRCGESKAMPVFPKHERSVAGAGERAVRVMPPKHAHVRRARQEGRERPAPNKLDEAAPRAGEDRGAGRQRLRRSFIPPASVAHIGPIVGVDHRRPPLRGAFVSRLMHIVECSSAADIDTQGGGAAPWCRSGPQLARRAHRSGRRWLAVSCARPARPSSGSSAWPTGCRGASRHPRHPPY